MKEDYNHNKCHDRKTELNTGIRSQIPPGKINYDEDDNTTDYNSPDWLVPILFLQQSSFLNLAMVTPPGKTELNNVIASPWMHGPICTHTVKAAISGRDILRGGLEATGRRLVDQISSGLCHFHLTWISPSQDFVTQVSFL